MWELESRLGAAGEERVLEGRASKAEAHGGSNAGPGSDGEWAEAGEGLVDELVARLWVLLVVIVNMVFLLLLLLLLLLYHLLSYGH